jgi:hypothetical protein
MFMTLLFVYLNTYFPLVIDQCSHYKLKKHSLTSIFSDTDNFGYQTPSVNAPPFMLQ